ncbi:MAG: hypothetical protein K2H01_12430 [Ruminococcus sp.]|nr:hypothetical protein [Ruminococcus sp.]
MKGIIFTADGVKCIFDEAEKLENIQSGESADVIFGKIQKWFPYFSEFSSLFDSNGNLILPADVTATDPSGKSVSLCSMKISLSKSQSDITELQRSLGMTKGKNLLKNTAATTTESGVTFTRNSDGSVTCNGTATQHIDISINKLKLPPGKTFILTGCPAEGDSSKYFLYVKKSGTTTYYSDVGDSPAGYLLTTASGPPELYEFGIFIKSGQKVSNLTFYPMLIHRDDYVYPNDYEPYVDDLQTQINELKAQIAVLMTANNTEE